MLRYFTCKVGFGGTKEKEEGEEDEIDGVSSDYWLTTLKNFIVATISQSPKNEVPITLTFASRIKGLLYLKKSCSQDTIVKLMSVIKTNGPCQSSDVVDIGLDGVCSEQISYRLSDKLRIAMASLFEIDVKSSKEKKDSEKEPKAEHKPRLIAKLRKKSNADPVELNRTNDSDGSGFSLTGAVNKWSSYATKVLSGAGKVKNLFTHVDDDLEIDILEFETNKKDQSTPVSDNDNRIMKILRSQGAVVEEACKNNHKERRVPKINAKSPSDSDSSKGFVELDWD